jgi:hypothetical protein
MDGRLIEFERQGEISRLLKLLFGNFCRLLLKYRAEEERQYNRYDRSEI